MDKNELLILQEVLLEMYNDLQRICFEEDIKIQLGGGTFLGAVRHKGFIPWDDDVDLMIFRDDVTKIIKLFENHPIYKIEFTRITDNHPFTFIKIKKIGTLLVEDNTKDYPVSKEIFIDIFIIENTPNLKMARDIHGYISNFLTKFSYVYYHWTYAEIAKNNSNLKFHFKNVMFTILSKIVKASTCVSLTERFYSVCKDRNSQLVSIPSGRNRYFGELYPREYFTELKEFQFEDLLVLGSSFYEKYLTQLYGEDYMIIPKKQDRESHGIIDFKLN